MSDKKDAPKISVWSAEQALTNAQELMERGSK